MWQTLIGFVVGNATSARIPPLTQAAMGIALYLTWVGGFLVTAVVLTRLLKGIKLI